MDHCLINPDQIHHFGIPLSNNTFYSNKDFGIYHENIFVLLPKKSSAVYFTAYFPTDEDLETFSHILLTDGESDWDPNNTVTENNFPYGDNNFKVML